MPQTVLASFSRIDGNWGKHLMTVFFVLTCLRQGFAMCSKLALNSLYILADLNLAAILLPQTPKCWGYKHVSRYPAYNGTLKTYFRNKEGANDEA